MVKLTRLIAVLVGLLLAGCETAVDEPVSKFDIEALRAMRSEAKFHEYPPAFYPGAPTEEVRARCEARLNEFLDELVATSPEALSKSLVLARMKVLLESFTLEDSEEQDRILIYLEGVLDTMAIQSSDGLFNTWRYGFDPT